MLASAIGEKEFGAVVVVLLLLSLLSKEILALAGEGQGRFLRRALNILVVPLSIVAGIALIQRIMGI